MIPRAEAINLVQFALGASVFGIAAALVPSFTTDVSLRANLATFLDLLAGMFLVAIGLTLWGRLLAVQEDKAGRELLKWAVPATLAAALAFWLIPLPALRAVAVIGFCLAALGLTVALVGLLGFRLLRSGRHFSPSLAVGLAVVLVSQVIVAGNLNSYADSQVLTNTPLFQSYYATVAVSVVQGNAIAAGYAPAGVTFATIATQNEKVSRSLLTLDTPGMLVDYAAQIKAWADQVDAVALGAETGGNWQDPPTTPGPFQMTMTSDQATSAYTVSTQQIATLVSFGNYALANKDPEGFLWVGARLAAQDYWLEGVYTSSDANPIQANLHFIEFPPFPSGSVSASVLAAPLAAEGPNTTTQRYSPPLSAPRSWGTPRPWPPGHLQCFVSCYPQLHTKLNDLTNISYSAVGPAFTTSYTATQSGWSGSQTDTLPFLGTDAFPPTPPAAPVKGQGPPPPQSFYNQCTYGGGVVNYVPNPVQNNLVALPANEGGWYCANPNPNGGWPNSGCWSYLSESGVQSAGGGVSCPQHNLVPAPLGPLGNVAQNLGNWAAPITSGGGPGIWDGSYQVGTTPSVNCAGSLLNSLPASVTAAMEAGMQSAAAQLFNSNAPLVVSHDATSDFGGSLTIDSSGQATLTPISAGGASVYGSLNFSHQGSSGAQVIVKITSAQPNFDCTFTFTGTKN